MHSFLYLFLFIGLTLNATDDRCEPDADLLLSVAHAQSFHFQTSAHKETEPVIQRLQTNPDNKDLQNLNTLVKYFMSPLLGCTFPTPATPLQQRFFCSLEKLDSAIQQYSEPRNLFALMCPLYLLRAEATKEIGESNIQDMQKRLKQPNAQRSLSYAIHFITISF